MKAACKEASGDALAPSPQVIILIGLVALAIAMGVGRFAFTPMMPLMLRDGSLDAVTGTEWATANYFGYLLGALSASWFAGNPRRGLRIGLLGVAVTTLGMVWGDAAVQWLGMALRFSAGVFSAWVMICASGWCLPELARRHATSLGGWVSHRGGPRYRINGCVDLAGRRAKCHSALGGARFARGRRCSVCSMAITEYPRYRISSRHRRSAQAGAAESRARKPGRGALLQRVRIRLHHPRDFPADDGAATGV